MIDMGLGQVISALLLVGRIACSVYLAKVIKVQNMLKRYPVLDDKGHVDHDVMGFRRNLNRMTLVILLGQIIPIILDAVNTLSGHTPAWLIYIYAVSNTITAVTSAVLIWKLYQMAFNTQEVARLEKAHIRAEKNK